MLWKLFAAFAFLGLVAGRAYVPMSRQDRLRQMLLQECTKYGGEDKVLEVQASGNKFVECVMAEIDQETLLQFRLAQYTNDLQIVVEVARKLCTKKTALDACFATLMDDVLPCVDPALRHRVNDSKKAVQDLGDYICKDNAAIISKLFEKDAMDCLEDMDKLTRITQCTRDIDAADVTTLTPKTRCNLYYDGRTCLIDNLRQCPVQTHADFTERVFDALVVGSYCENKTEIIDNDTFKYDVDENALQDIFSADSV